MTNRVFKNIVIGQIVVCEKEDKTSHPCLYRVTKISSKYITAEDSGGSRLTFSVSTGKLSKNHRWNLTLPNQIIRIATKRQTEKFERSERYEQLQYKLENLLRSHSLSIDAMEAAIDIYESERTSCKMSRLLKQANAKPGYKEIMDVYNRYQL
jgi:hypothetical protein